VRREEVLVKSAELLEHGSRDHARCAAHAKDFT
jgi:hypothetical protein